MIEIVATSEHKDSHDNVYYVADSKKLNSMSKKYNYAVEKYCLPSNEQYFCFRHNDLIFNTAPDVMKYKLDKLFENEKIGVAGLIGTYALEASGVWWMPNRPLNTCGNIIQGYPDGKTAPMPDWPGTHLDVATVDGCCIFVSRKLFEAGIRFDENLPSYHFYDADICCQALAAGFTNATIDILATHQSVGEMPPEFKEYQKNFIEKWTKKIDFWPISKYTKFK